MIEKTIKISMLYDFYSPLLTERQRDIIDYYYNQDFSLGEIAEIFSISRQAVYDTIKRTEKIMYEYEERLKLIELYSSRAETIKKTFIQVEQLDKLIKKNAPKEELEEEIRVIKILLTDIHN
ncbi:putative DNA-binding protein [Alkaliphilus pronyensis]|uniref:UPF0122 protein F8154_07075 n=2 Tax=Alkaliphilus pronyensis TaxID=1482732 RepID=A0A6I0EZZ5_9FIRM|nr:putative DNA-binding protein [Alkaliphilus pronyensis]